MGILDFLGLGNKTNEVQEYVQKGAIILDVRTPEEFRDGHIKGSKNIALQVLNGNIETIKKWNKPVIACCRSGMRSATACDIMRQLAFVNAYNLIGGIIEWDGEVVEP